ncbi:MAG: FGGY-family carbohydrate kinase, partial [Anaerolineae bacterium]|nr:FGGY-family carbohydrate kinase [Anaerolineae bacterium]
PRPLRAGEDAGSLTAEGSRLTGLPEGIPVAPAEGDQPAALAGSLIGEAGMVSLSLGTSICANAVGDRPFKGVHPAIDHFCAPDGKPINMVWLRNGTTFMNVVIDLIGSTLDKRSARFAAVMPGLLAAPPDCGGIAALPFLDDEPGLGIRRGGLAMLAGLTGSNASVGNIAKAAFLATLYNLRSGIEVLDRQGYPRTELVLSGGLIRTPEIGQIVADVLNTPAVILHSATEGCAWGAALMAKYRDARLHGEKRSWAEFLASHAGGDVQRFEPNPAAADAYTLGYQRHRRMLELANQLDAALSS